MQQTLTNDTTGLLVLRATTAADLMSKNPVSLSWNATLAEAGKFLIEKEISAAPVIDDGGRAVGVLSHTDLVRHDFNPPAKDSNADFYRVADLFWPPAIRPLMHGQKADNACVRDIMTPTVLSIAPDATAVAVVAELLALKVHRLFVVDEAQVLVGVISTFDVLRKLHK